MRAARLPRASATRGTMGDWVCWATSATMVTAGRPGAAGSMAYFCISRRSISIPAIRVLVATVFCCVASRNKRRGPAGGKERVYPKNKGSLYPTPRTGASSIIILLCNLGGSDAREERQLSTRKRHVAGLPRGGVRPARPKGSQEQSSQSPPQFCRVQPVALFSGVRPRRASLSPRTAIRRTAKARPIRPRF